MLDDLCKEFKDRCRDLEDRCRVLEDYRWRPSRFSLKILMQTFKDLSKISTSDSGQNVCFKAKTSERRGTSNVLIRQKAGLFADILGEITEIKSLPTSQTSTFVGSVHLPRSKKLKLHFIINVLCEHVFSVAKRDVLRDQNFVYQKSKELENLSLSAFLIVADPRYPLFEII